MNDEYDDEHTTPLHHTTALHCTALYSVNLKHIQHWKTIGQPPCVLETPGEPQVCSQMEERRTLYLS